MRILITGASGFIGSHLVSQALSRGYEVWAGMRATSSHRYLPSQSVHFITLHLDSVATLSEELAAFKSQNGGGWDYIIHAAGATKGRNEQEFMETNYEGTCHLVEALRQQEMLPKRMLYMSSLSVLGAIKEHPAHPADGHVYAPMTDGDVARPNTAYGRSKLASEKYLLQQSDLNVVIMRPTGVYGPRERDYYLMAKSLKQHLDFSVGYKPQEITFIYVLDLVEACFIALERGTNGSRYLVSDGNTYHSDDFSRLLKEQMGIRHVLPVKAPLWLLYIVCAVGGLMAKVTGRMTALNRDKYNILKQRNWRCDISPLLKLGYQPAWDLERGVKATVDWYKQAQWI